MFSIITKNAFAIDNIKISTAIMQVLKNPIFAQEKQDAAPCASSELLFVLNKYLFTVFPPKIRYD